MCACCVTQITLTPAWPSWLHFSFSLPQDCVALCFRGPLRFCNPFLWDCPQLCGKNTPAHSWYCTAKMCFIGFTVFWVPEYEGYWFWAVPLLGFWCGEARQRQPLPPQRAGRPVLSMLAVSPPCDCLQLCERCIRRIRSSCWSSPWRAPELVHTLVLESRVFIWIWSHRANTDAQIYCKYRSTATKKEYYKRVYVLFIQWESVRNVPQASPVLSLLREVANGGRLAVQVEDKLVKVRNMKVSRLIWVLFLIRSVA